MNRKSMDCGIVLTVSLVVKYLSKYRELVVDGAEAHIIYNLEGQKRAYISGNVIFVD